jgi:hypothetical protein
MAASKAVFLEAFWLWGMGKTMQKMGKGQGQVGELDDITLIEKALSRTFECERFHCKIFPESCVKRQSSWDPEVYEGCMGCKQGLETAKRVKLKDQRILIEPVVSRSTPYLDNEWYEPFALLALSSGGGK